VTIAEQAALSLAVTAHDGQVDKAGLPYVLHPIRVGMSLRAYGLDAVVAGYLHDVIEDTDLTPFDLRVAGVSSAAASAILSVTKQGSERGAEAYADSVKRAMEDPLGRYVKAADILDNFGRLDGLPDGEQRTRLFRKYLAVESIVAWSIFGFRLTGPLPQPPEGWSGT